MLKKSRPVNLKGSRDNLRYFYYVNLIIIIIQGGGGAVPLDPPPSLDPRMVLVCELCNYDRITYKNPGINTSRFDSVPLY